MIATSLIPRRCPMWAVKISITTLIQPDVTAITQNPTYPQLSVPIYLSGRPQGVIANLNSRMAPPTPRRGWQRCCLNKDEEKTGLAEKSGLPSCSGCLTLRIFRQEVRSIPGAADAITI